MEIAGVSWREFKLSDSFINAYHGKQPNWGPLGYVTFLRTYSRYLDESGETKEEFWQTLQRVVEGTFNLQKYHCHTFNIPWNQSKAMARAERMYDKMWRFQFLPSGRGLWLMGTDFMRKHGSAGLNSCAFTTTENIHKFPVDPFTWAMEISMLGVGVGFDTRGAARLRVQEPSGIKDVVIEDSREGWVASLEVLLEAFFMGKALPKFDYSQIRPRGQLLKHFGGRSSGPDPLINMHQGLIEVLSPRIGEKLTSVDIVDIFTNIGKCVVSGNIRRSAMIALGDVEDEEFKNLKLDQAKMMSNRWASNNSVFGYHGMDYRDIVERCSVNGEPGIVWLDNVRGYGRLADGYTGIDNRVMGVNPCGEQPMEPDELCNLIETFPVNHSSLSEYKETLEDALLYGKSVTLLNTKWPRTNGVMSRNRRLGISQTGITEFFGKVGLPEARVWCEEGYQHLREEDFSVSQFLCIRESIKLTSVKPSGSISLLPGVSPGIHYPHSEYYIRRMRLASDSTLLPMLRDAGYPMEPDVKEPGMTTVVEFPIRSYPFVRGKESVPVWQQLENAAFYQHYWSDNNVSITVTFNEDEKEDLIQALPYYERRLKVVSMLMNRSGAYQQAPYEEISAEEYERRVQAVREIDYGRGGSDQAVGEMYCTNDTCSLHSEQ